MDTYWATIILTASVSFATAESIKTTPTNVTRDDATRWVASQDNGELPLCEVSGEGLVGALWKKHRILLDQEVITGTDDLDQLLGDLRNLRQQKICQ